MRLRMQLLLQNNCCRAWKIIRPKGVMIHSTGANNPNVSRYVPGNDEIGRNTTGNHWDQSNEEWQAKFGTKLNKCVHAFVGRFADGQVGTVQTLPLNVRGWHAGDSVGNDLYLGIEICEDDLNDETYFRAVYREAVELTAHWCRLHGWDPLADDVIICHAEGHQLGIASNHGDVMHWFPRFGVNMDDFRADVAREMEDDDMDAKRFRELFLEMRSGLQDNDSAQWSQQARQWAIDNGLISGGAPGPDGQPNYMWEDLLTREQMVQLLFRFAQYMGKV